jgi:hypothetical protein
MIFFLIKLRKRNFPVKSNRTTAKQYRNTSIFLNFNTRNKTRRSMRMFVPFSKTRKCGGCFRH